MSRVLFHLGRIVVLALSWECRPQLFYWSRQLHLWPKVGRLLAAQEEQVAEQTR